jgi:hypothetical protein
MIKEVFENMRFHDSHEVTPLQKRLRAGDTGYSLAILALHWGN